MSRIVMFVFNDCRTDSRVLREARSLATAGHEVAIIARPKDGTSTIREREERDGFTIVRVPIPQGYRLFRLWLKYPWRVLPWANTRARRGLGRMPGGLVDLAVAGAGLVASAPLGVVRAPFYLRARYRNRAAMAARAAGGLPARPALARPPSPAEWLMTWRWVIGAWARDAAAEAAPADVYHGHDLHGLAAAARAQAEHGGALVYDSHEIFLESGTTARRPAWARFWFARSERRWVARADALVTVNDALARELGRRYRPRRTIVVHNCPERWDPPPVRVDALRRAAGITDDAPVALYHGGFSEHRGIEELAEAILEPGLERVHAVFLGYGPGQAGLELLAGEARFGGRVHVLEAVLPEALVDFISTADVGVMPIQSSTLNHILSTPNKLFECLAAGVPVVVSDLPEMRRIAMDDPEGPLGTVCDPASPASIARAIREVLDRPAADGADLRARCLRAAHARWNWETEVARLLALYDDLARPVAATVHDPI